MPIRPYNSVNSFEHLEKLLRAQLDAPSDSEILEFKKSGFPPIIYPENISLFLGISNELLESIWNEETKSSDHYRKIYLKKKDGSIRKIDAPRTYLKVIQWWILDNILNKVSFDRNIFGFVLGRNIVQNAEFHFGAKHILNVDIKNFFPSISFSQVSDVFMSLGYSEKVSNALANICCLDNRVPQGAPTSPALGNLVLRKLDIKLTNLSEIHAIRYSRYADDITFSSQHWIDDKFLSYVDSLIRKEGFEINRKKTRFAGPQDRMEVTGIVVNQKIQPPRKWRKRVRAILHDIGSRDVLKRSELAYLFGIIGVTGQYPESTQMKLLSNKARYIVNSKRNTVVSYGNSETRFGNLSDIQVKILVKLAPTTSNAELSEALGVPESMIKRNLLDIYNKLDVMDRHAAMEWAKKNL